MEERTVPTKEEQAVELLVFLFLILPSIVVSLFALETTDVGFVPVAVSTIFRDLALVALILFFLWRNREPVERIGWTTESLRNNLLLGVVLFPPVLLGAALLEAALRALGLSGAPDEIPFLVPEGYAQLALAFLLIIVVAVSEETIFRGYLIARLSTVSESIPLAVILSSAIFAVGHGYQGAAGLVTVGFLGLVFALLFVWRQSLVAPMVIHFLNNFVAIILIPVLGSV